MSDIPAQNITFPLDAGLDMDSDFGSVKGWRFAIGCRHGTTEEGNLGVIENPLGTVMVSYELPAGENEVIGTAKDVQNNAIIYMVWNSEDNHRILRYFFRTNTIEQCTDPVYDSDLSVLGFDRDFPIYTARIVYYETGMLLCWTDRLNEPRQLNITRAISGEYTLIDEQAINLIKRPPQEPLAVYGSDTTVKTNSLSGYLWQFRYAYLYEDNQQSTYSAISNLPLPENVDTVDGPYRYNDSSTNNRLEVTLNTGHETVKSLLVAVRQGNTGNWFLADILDKEEEGWGDNATVTYNFYNNQNLKALSSQDSNLPFSFIPRKAGFMEFTQGNNLVLADYLEGFDLPKPNVSMAYDEVEVAALDDTHLWKFSAAYQATPSAFAQEFYFWTILSPASNLAFPDSKHPDIDENAIMYFDIEQGGVSFGFFHKLATADLTNWPNDLLSNVCSELNTSIFPFLTGMSSPFSAGTPFTENGFTYVPTSYGTTDPLTFKNLTVVRPIDIARTYKRGSTPKFGLVYEDAEGRKGSVVTNKNFKQYVKFWTEEHSGSNYEDVRHSVIQLQMTINHLPPTWATRYRVVYGGNGLRKFVQFILRRPPSTVDGLMNWRIDPLLKYQSQHAPTQVNYSFEEGDRLRMITTRDNDVVNGYVDVEIVGFEPANNIIKTKAIDSTDLGIGDYSLVEIYGLRKDNIADSDIWFEIAAFDIENGFHQANTQDQDADDPAIVLLDQGDAYQKPRNFVNTLSVGGASTNPEFPSFEWVDIVESECFSDFFPSEDIGIGRVNAVVEGFKQKWLNGVRHGEKVFENTQLNGLSMFLENNYVIMPNKQDRIYGLAEVEYVLKVLQQTKTTSIYLNRTSSFNPDGSESLILVDRVFGTVRPSAEDYGTLLPGSVMVHNRHLYFYDLNKGVYVRDAANGQVAISDYGVKSFLNRRSLQLQLQDPDNLRAYSEWDEQTGQVFFTVVDRTNINPVAPFSLSFHEGSNRWKSFHPFFNEDNKWPEQFASQGKNMVSFLDGELHVHNRNDLRNNYYGRQHAQKITLVAAEPYNEVKLFTWLTVHSNKKWSCPTKGDVRIPGSEMYPSGMDSMLHPNWFEGVEGTWNVAFRRDMNTPGTNSIWDGVNNGDPLRGFAILVTLTNEYDEPVLLRGAIVESFISMKH